MKTRALMFVLLAGCDCDKSDAWNAAFLLVLFIISQAIVELQRERP